MLDARPLDLAGELECGHGRIEQRNLRVAPIDSDISPFPHARQVLSCTRIYTSKNGGEDKTETRYFITSIDSGKRTHEQFAAIIRNHWSVENLNHWKRDSSMWREDRSAWRCAKGANYLIEVTDANSLMTPSQTVTVDMLPTGAGIVISAPTNNATVSGSARVRVTAPAATRVAFYLDGVLQVTDSSSPFAWSWNTATANDGLRALTAKAYNGSTLLGTSTGVQVTVSNPPASGSWLDTNEPNNSSVTATLLTLGTTNSAGYIETPSDVDWFRIPVDRAGMLTVTLSVPAGNDFDLELYGPDGTWVAGSYNPAGQNERIDFPAPLAGTNYARTYGYPVGNGSFNTSQHYQIAASLGEPVASGMWPSCNLQL